MREFRICTSGMSKDIRELSYIFIDDFILDTYKFGWFVM